MRCMQCGAWNSEANSYCGSCGQPVAGGAPRGAQRVLQTLPDDVPDTPRVSIVKTALITTLVILVLLAVVITAASLVANGSNGAATSTTGVTTPDTQSTTAPVIVAANTAPSQPAATDTAIPTDAPTQTPDQWAKDAEQLSFADIRDHPDLQYGVARLTSSWARIHPTPP